MSIPDEIYAHAVLRRGDEVLLGVDTEPTNEPDSTRYIRADMHEALKAEVQALKSELLGALSSYFLAISITDMTPDDKQAIHKDIEPRIQRLESELEQADD